MIHTHPPHTYQPDSLARPVGFSRGDSLWVQTYKIPLLSIDYVPDRLKQPNGTYREGKRGGHSATDSTTTYILYPKDVKGVKLDLDPPTKTNTPKKKK